ncbi:MAG: DUF2249 domain-containing protein [Bacteroidota bacterium]
MTDHKVRISKEIDVRKLSAQLKHPTIFDAFKALHPGETMQLIHDHNPRPLHYQFDYEFSGTYEWNALEEGPEVWRVNITKTQEL